MTTRIAVEDIMSNDSVPQPVDSDQMRMVRVLFVGARSIGLFATDIETIADWRTPARLPGAPPSVLGVVCIRGRLVTVLDASALLGESAAAPIAKVVALHGDEQIGLAVSSAGNLLEVAPDEIKATVEMNPLVIGVIEKTGTRISVLNSQQLFATAMHGRERRRRAF
jgi:chemotaxis signal transduction protein